MCNFSCWQIAENVLLLKFGPYLSSAARGLMNSVITFYVFFSDKTKRKKLKSYPRGIFQEKFYLILIKWFALRKTPTKSFQISSLRHKLFKNSHEVIFKFEFTIMKSLLNSSLQFLVYIKIYKKVLVFRNLVNSIFTCCFFLFCRTFLYRIIIF